MPTPTNPFRRSYVPRGTMFDTGARTEGNIAAREAYAAAQEAFELQQQEKRELKKRELIAWAETAGKDEKWVADTFDITPEGVRVGGNLDLSGTKITTLPEGLTVGGNLDLNNTSITTLPEGLTVG